MDHRYDGQGRPTPFEEHVRRMVVNGNPGAQELDNRRPTVRLPPPGSYQPPQPSHRPSPSPPAQNPPNANFPATSGQSPDVAVGQVTGPSLHRQSQRQRRMQGQAQHEQQTGGPSNVPQSAFPPHQRSYRQQVPLDPNAFHRGGQVQGYRQQPQHPQRNLFDPRAHRGPPSSFQPDWRVRQAQHLDHVAATEVIKVEMSQAEHDEKDAFRQALQRVIQDVCATDPGRLPQVTLECFGSFRSGFASAGSDMDLVIVLQDGTPYTACFSLLEDDLPRALEKRLLQSGYGARLLTRTRVPIIKICEKPDDGLLDKLRQEREKWDALPHEKKYPHLHQNEADGETEANGNVAEDVNSTVGQTGTREVPLTDGNTAHNASENGSQTKAKEQPSGQSFQQQLQHPPASNDHESSSKDDPNEPKQAYPRRELPRPWTRERKAGPLDFPKSGVGIQSDINFFNPLGLHNTQLLRCYSMCDPRVRPFVLFVKAWAKRRKINSSYSGTLSSYGYVLMVLHYLMNIAQPPVIPNLQLPWRPNSRCTPPGTGRTEVDGWTVEFWRNEDEITDALRQGQMSSNHESLGSLLAGFFQYYSSQGGFPQFHWMGEVLSLRTAGGIMSKADKGWVKAVMEEGEGKKIQHRYLFCIEDPFELAHNVARTVTHNGIVAIRDEFRRARRILSAVGNGQHHLSPDGELFAEVVEVDTAVEAIGALHLGGSNGPVTRPGTQERPEPGSGPSSEVRALRPARNRDTAHQYGSARTATPPQPSKRLDVKDNGAFPTLATAKPRPANSKNEPAANQSEISGDRAKAYLEELRRKRAEVQAEQTAYGAAESVLGGDD